jgi:TolB-like protein/DNA-binding winged helix-turn-helix (wHTH) protein
VDNDFRVGAWIVRPSLNTISQNGTSSRLEPKVMQVLVCLAAQPGESVPKEAILKTVWPETFVSDDVLIRSISELRRVFEDDAREPRFIETIPKRGYRLVARVSPVNGGTANNSEVVARDPSKPAQLNWKVGWLSVTALVLLSGILVGFNVADFRAYVFGVHPPIHSLAVLPLKNLSDDPSQKYFASGMTEELITDLSQISTLKVISRTSSEVYDNTHKSLPEIARELKVDAIIEGSVERSGKRVRINAQLIYAPEDKNLWARSYDRDLQDALAVQGTLANAIADEIRLRVAPNVQVHINASRPVSATVLDNYLQGNYYLHLVGRGSVDEGASRAARYFQQAIVEDPSFAPAYIGLARTHASILTGPGLMNPSPEDYEIRRAATNKAVELDPQSSDAHGLLASLYAEDWKWSQAEEELNTAIVLNPNNADVHDEFANFLIATGRLDRGLKEERLAQELDPNSDRLSGTLAYEGKYNESIRLQIRDLQRQPDDGYAHYGLFQTYALAGQYPQAIKELKEAGTLMGFPEFEAPIDHAFRTAGFEAAIHLLARNFEKLQKEKKIYAPDILAEFYGVIGDKDRAFYWLEDAYRHKHSSGAGGGLIWLKGNPMYASLRSDPRYADLVRRVGLPQ